MPLFRKTTSGRTRLRTYIQTSTFNCGGGGGAAAAAAAAGPGMQRVHIYATIAHVF